MLVAALVVSLATEAVGKLSDGAFVGGIALLTLSGRLESPDRNNRCYRNYRVKSGLNALHK